MPKSTVDSLLRPSWLGFDRKPVCKMDQQIVLGTSIEESKSMEFFSNTFNEIEAMTTIPRLAWGLNEVSECTGLSVAFLRAEVRAGRLPVRRFGRRVLVRDEDLKVYLSRGSGRESIDIPVVQVVPKKGPGWKRTRQNCGLTEKRIVYLHRPDGK